MVSFQMIQNDFQKTVQRMLDKSNAFQGASSRIYPLYQKFQTDRFQTQGQSEGTPWPSLNPEYAQYKKIRFGGGPKVRSKGKGKEASSWKSWPGQGTKMMIATSTLAGAVIGPGSPFVSEGINQHRAIFTPNSMEISVEQSGNNAEGRPFDYAGYADEKRPIMQFSDEHIEEMSAAITQFLFEEE